MPAPQRCFGPVPALFRSGGGAALGPVPGRLQRVPGRPKRPGISRLTEGKGAALLPLLAAYVPEARGALRPKAGRDDVSTHNLRALAPIAFRMSAGGWRSNGPAQGWSRSAPWALPPTLFRAHTVPASDVEAINEAANS